VFAFLCFVEVSSFGRLFSSFSWRLWLWLCLLWCVGGYCLGGFCCLGFVLLVAYRWFGVGCCGGVCRGVADCVFGR